MQMRHKTAQKRPFFIILFFVTILFSFAYYVETFRPRERNFDADHVITTLDNGLKIIVNRHDHMVCKALRTTGQWDVKETKVLRKMLRPGFRVVEVGANFGVYTLLMADLVGDQGKIYAFEANPYVSRYLMQSLAMNALESRVTVFEKAVSNKSYHGSMVYNLLNIGAGYILPETAAMPKVCAKGSCAPITVTTLDHAIGHQQIDLLKIDAEGSEPWILEGAHALLKNNPKLILMMEWEPTHLRRNNIDIPAFITRLGDLGFHYCWFVNQDGVLETMQLAKLASSGPLDIVLYPDQNIP